MSHLTRLVIILNFVGLSAVQIFETWRPGSVAALVSYSWLLTGVLVTTVGAILVSKRD